MEWWPEVNKVAVITAASEGIGAASARVFAQAGYDLILNYHKSEENAHKVAQECKTYGVEVQLVKADALSEEGINKIFAAAKEYSPKIDVLINNVADTSEANYEDLGLDDIQKVLGNGLGALMYSTKLFSDILNEGGSILNTSSIYGTNFGASVGMPVYSAAKAGLINFTEWAAKKYAPTIRVNAVAPGFTRTPHWDTVDPERAKSCIESTLLKKWVEPEDIATTFLFLVNNSSITAETIVVDAGWRKK